MIQVRQVFYWCVLTSLMVQAGGFVQAGIVYDTPGSVYQQNFDSLPNTAPALTVAWTNDSTLVGWHGYGGTNGITAITQIAPYSGSGTFVSGLQSLGTTAADRAFGSTTLALNSIVLATSFANSTGNSLDTFGITYDGEQWRRGANANTETLQFAYGFGDSYATVTSWTNVSALNFTTPIAAPGTAVGLNGNLPANRRANITSTISGVDWASGDSLWLRWTDPPDAGDDHGLAIDNFSFTASSTITAVPEPSSIVLFGIAAVAGAGRLAGRAKRKRASLSKGDS